MTIWCKAGIVCCIILAAWSLCLLLVVNRRIETYVKKPNPHVEKRIEELNVKLLEMHYDVHQLREELDERFPEK
jgi:hypothetical protein